MRPGRGLKPVFFSVAQPVPRNAARLPVVKKSTQLARTASKGDTHLWILKWCKNGCGLRSDLKNGIGVGGRNFDGSKGYKVVLRDYFD